VFARGVEDGTGVTFDLLGEPDRALATREQFFQEMSAAGELHLLQVVTVEIEQVEGEEHGISGRKCAAPPAKRPLQRAKVRAILLVQNDSFAVEDRAPDAQLEHCLGNGRKPNGLVVTAPSEEPDAAGFDMDRASEAVELDFWNGARIAGRLRLQERQRGFHPSRQGVKKKIGLRRIALSTCGAPLRGLSSARSAFRYLSLIWGLLQETLKHGLRRIVKRRTICDPYRMQHDLHLALHAGLPLSARLAHFGHVVGKDVHSCCVSSADKRFG